jgi:hypothetical protein
MEVAHRTVADHRNNRIITSRIESSHPDNPSPDEQETFWASENLRSLRVRGAMLHNAGENAQPTYDPE